MLAVAQHYGLATTFVDFTTDPCVGGFFAADGNQTGDRPVLLCVNEADYLEDLRIIADAWPEMAQHILAFKFERPSTPNLWRMESQACVFLYTPVLGDIESSLSHFDRIVIEGPPSSSIPLDHIYPTRKSDLERLLDQYFARERLLSTQPVLEEVIASGALPKDHVFRMEGPGNFYLNESAEPHSSWGMQDPAAWLEGRIPPEPLPEKGPEYLASPTDWDDVRELERELMEGFLDALNKGALLRTRHETFRIEGADTHSISATDQTAKRLADLWDGMRRLPFTDQQLAQAMARLVCLAACPEGQTTLIADPIDVQFGTEDHSFSRAVAATDRVREAIRPDIEQVLKPGYVDRLRESPRVALLWVPNPRMLFTFAGFVDLLVADVLPAQMLRGKWQRSPLFSPWRITVFGLP